MTSLKQKLDLRTPYITPLNIIQVSAHREPEGFQILDPRVHSGGGIRRIWVGGGYAPKHS